MSSKVIRAFLGFVVCGMVACAFQARADQFVPVSDDINGILDPDPVVIVTGQVVYWVDDGSGPYFISSISGPASFSTQTGGSGIQFTLPGHYVYMESGSFAEGTVIVTPNVPPLVTITNPTNNAVLAAPATFDFTANAFDSDADGLSDVEFYVGTNEVDDIFDPGPFTTTVSNLAAGTYQLSAVAFDNVGASTTNTITIQVGSATPIRLSAPKMVAGTFQFTISGLTVGKTNIVQSSTNPPVAASWVPVVTSVATNSTISFTNVPAGSRNFYRVVQLP